MTLPPGGARTPFGQVPVLEIDGVAFSQSAALLRYAGRQAGMYPDGLLQLRVDMVEAGPRPATLSSPVVASASSSRYRAGIA